MEKREKWPSLEILEDSLSGWRKRKRNRSRRGMNFEEITEVHVSGFWILTNHWSFCDVRLWDISNGFVAIMSDPSETLCWNSWQLIEILRDHIERESNRKFYSLSLAKILSTSPSLMESCEILSFPTMARHEMRLWLTEAGRGGRRKGGEDWTDCNNSTSRERTMLYPTRFIRSRSTRTRHLETRNWGRAGSNYCRSITWIQYRFLVAFCFPFQSKEYSVLQTNPISKVEQSLEQGVVYSLITKSRDVAVLSSGNITCCLNPRFVIRSLSSAVNFPPFLSFPPSPTPFTSPPPLHWILSRISRRNLKNQGEEIQISVTIYRESDRACRSYLNEVGNMRFIVVVVVVAVVVVTVIVVTVVVVKRENLETCLSKHIAVSCERFTSFLPFFLSRPSTSSKNWRSNCRIPRRRVRALGESQNASLQSAARIVLRWIDSDFQGPGWLKIESSHYSKD